MSHDTETFLQSLCDYIVAPVNDHRNLIGVQDRYIMSNHNKKHMTAQVHCGVVKCEESSTRKDARKPEQKLTVI